MLTFNIKKDIRTFKSGQQIKIDLDVIKYTALVGKNGCGKSTLFHALRAKFPRKKEINLWANDLTKLLDSIEIITDYEEIIFLDTIMDDPSDMNNAYDACSYIDSGGFAAKNLSHGQKQLNMMISLLDTIKPTSKKSLVVFDEVDTGFDLRFQKAYMNISKKLMIEKSYHSIMITHNTIAMMMSHIVFDLEDALLGNKGFKNAKTYLNEKIEMNKIWEGA